MEKIRKYAIVISILFFSQLFINEKLAFSVIEVKSRFNKKISRIALLNFTNSKDIKIDENLIRRNIADKLKINVLSQKEMIEIEEDNNLIRPESSTLNEQIKDYGENFNIDFLIVTTIIESNSRIEIVINFYPFQDFPKLESVFFLNKFSLKKFNQKGNKKLSDLIISKFNVSYNKKNRILYTFVAVVIATNYFMNKLYDSKKGTSDSNRLTNPPKFP